MKSTFSTNKKKAFIFNVIKEKTKFEKEKLSIKISFHSQKKESAKIKLNKKKKYWYDEKGMI